MQFTEDSIIFLLPKLFNTPFVPFLLGIALGFLIAFFFGLLLRYKRIKTEKFGGIVKDNNVNSLNSTQVIYRARASLELLRLFIILREARLKYRPVFNSTIKKVAQLNEAAIKVLAFEGLSFFQFIGSWPNNSIKLREMIISLAQFSRSPNLENKEYKAVLMSTIEEATMILNRELKD